MQEKVKGIGRREVMGIKKNIIIPKVGFGFLKFGMGVKDVENHLGRAEEIENPDEYGDIYYSYENKGINFLRFSKDENFRLTSIELNNKSKAILWQTEIFGLTQEKIKNLSANMGYSLKLKDSVKDSDTDEVFEELYRIESLYISFYFNEFKILEEISIGAPFNENDEIEWPA